MVGIHISPEDFTLVSKGNAFLFPMSEVSYIFAGKPPTKKRALKFIAANPAFVDLVEDLYAHSRARKRLQKRLDEMNAKLAELKKGLEEHEKDLRALGGQSESCSEEEESLMKGELREN